MQTKTIEAPKVSPANTKKEILEAYEQLKEQMETAGQDELKPEKEKEAKQKKEVLAVAETCASTKVIDSIGALKAGVNETLTEIAAKMEHEVLRYIKVKEAIAAREEELKEIFEIEQGAYSLAALLETQKKKRAVFEEEMSQARSEWEQEKNNRAALQKEKREQEEKRRLREEEEYTYTLMREREQKTNALNDEISRLEKELAQKKEAFEQKVSAKEAELKERESAVAVEEKRLVGLEVQVERFPAELEQAVKKTVKETTDRLMAATAKDEELLRKTFEGEKNVFTARIEAFEGLATEQKKQIAQLTSQLEKAYGKVQDIAIQAVSSPRDRFAGESQMKARGQNDE